MAKQQKIADTSAQIFFILFSKKPSDYVGFNKKSPSKLAYISNFLGLPSEFPATENKLTWRRLIKNIFAWPETNQHNSQIKRRFALLMMPFAGIYQLLQSPFKTSWNLLRIVTEFLPRMMVIISRYYAKEFAEQPKTFTNTLSFQLLSALTRLAQLLVIVGRSITSPINNVKLLYTGSTRARNPILGTVFALVGISMTAAFYFILFPLMVNAIIANFPALALQAGTFIGENMPWLIQVGSTITASVFVQSVIGSVTSGATLLVHAVTAFVSACVTILFAAHALIFLSDVFGLLKKKTLLPPPAGADATKQEPFDRNAQLTTPNLTIGIVSPKSSFQPVVGSTAHTHTSFSNPQSGDGVKGDEHSCKPKEPDTLPPPIQTQSVSSQSLPISGDGVKGDEHERSCKPKEPDTLPPPIQTQLVSSQFPLTFWSPSPREKNNDVSQLPTPAPSS